mgnify:CR=1 FL=1|tara:strand:+ start:716 stop:913 length:198 start_codon:yes stop_codon:yes gene_type:complete
MKSEPDKMSAKRKNLEPFGLIVRDDEYFEQSQKIVDAFLVDGSKIIQVPESEVENNKENASLEEE